MSMLTLNKWLVTGVLIACIAVAVTIRVVIPYDNVYTDNGVQLNTVDAYYSIRYADTYPDIIDYDYFYSYPGGQQVTDKSIFFNIIGGLASITGYSNKQVGVVLPVFLFALTLVTVFFIIRLLFKNNAITLAGTGILSIMPGEVLTRTMLGSADYHCLEMLLLSLCMLAAIAAIKNLDRYTGIFYIICLIGVITLYYYSWAGALLVVFILLAFLYVLAMTKLKDTRLKFTITAAMCLAYISAFMFSSLIGKSATRLLSNIPANMFMWNIHDNISEGMPLFFSSGYFDMNVSWSYMGITFYLMLAGIGWLAYRYYKRQDNIDLLLLVWTAVMLAITLTARRYHYYLGINAAILSGFVLYHLVRYIGTTKSRMVKMLVIAVMITGLPLLRGSIVQAQNFDNYIPEHIQDCINWLKQYSNDEAYYTGEKTDYGILTSSNYGYWIVEEAHIPVYITPGSHRRESFYNQITNDSYYKVHARLKSNQLKYILIDDAMVTTGLYPTLSMSVHSSDENFNLENTLLIKLYNRDNIEGYELVYSNNKAVIYEIK